MSLPRLNSFQDHPERMGVRSASSHLSELYHQYDIHMNVLKWTGVIVLFGLTASTLGVTSNLYKFERSHWNAFDCINIQEQPNFNSTSRPILYDSV